MYKDTIYATYLTQNLGVFDALYFILMLINMLHAIFATAFIVKPTTNNCSATKQIVKIVAKGACAANLIHKSIGSDSLIEDFMLIKN